MNWNEQAETMAKTWAEAQKKMWESWHDLGQTASTPPYANMADKWREMAAQGFEAWTGNTGSTAKNTFDSMFESQKTTMCFFEFSINIWKLMAEKMETGEDWQSVLTEYTDKLRQELTRWPQAAFNMAQDSGNLWQVYQDELQNLAMPWLKTWQQTPDHLGQNGSGMLELTRLFWDTYEQTFGRLLESPSVGYGREIDEKVRQNFKAWLRCRRADVEYRLVMGEAWVKLFEQLQRELVALAEKGETIQSLEALTNLWLNIADPVFIEVFHSEKYIQVQNELLHATMTQRIQQREIIELLLKQFDIPTRTEVDEAHRNIYKQRKEIKLLKKAIAQVSGSMEASKQKAETSTELSQACQEISTLQEEVNVLKVALAEVSAETKQVEELRLEIETLKRAAKSSRSTSKPKQTSTAAKISAKAKNSKEEV